MGFIFGHQEDRCPHPGLTAVAQSVGLGPTKRKVIASSIPARAMPRLRIQSRGVCEKQLIGVALTSMFLPLSVSLPTPLSKKKQTKSCALEGARP